MIALHGRSPTIADGDPRVVRLTEHIDGAQPSLREAQLVDDGNVVPGYGAYFHRGSAQGFGVELPDELRYLSAGDIVRLSPTTGAISVLYRRQSHHNVIFMTEQCNSRCIMCSQPPKDEDDSYRVQYFLDAIPLMDPATKELGISGGEPTLMPDLFLKVVESCNTHLPTTALHVLSNGRVFSYLSLAKRLGDIKHPDLMVGIPLYSDLPSVHDYVVQAQGAFDQTIRGILALKRCGVRVEIRVVLTRPTVDRLDDIARFIVRNLSFVDHVTFMGLERKGFGKAHFDELWTQPESYAARLATAIGDLGRAFVPVSIYNLPLCFLTEKLRPFARQSISDWKREYAKACNGCSQREACCGAFAWNVDQFETLVTPITEGTDALA